ncbi:hypothetical protein XI25_23955 [Paenibacillus sp. DMB20]|nr:hypothetical protein XI25_23955 [Paenibacillus sp. DMB20]
MIFHIIHESMIVREDYRHHRIEMALYTNNKAIMRSNPLLCLDKKILENGQLIPMKIKSQWNPN